MNAIDEPASEPDNAQAKLALDAPPLPAGAPLLPARTRPLAVGGAPALPMYVQARGAKVAKKGEVLEVSLDDEKVGTARLMDVSQLVLQGGVYLTGPRAA